MNDILVCIIALCTYLGIGIIVTIILIICDLLEMDTPILVFGVVAWPLVLGIIIFGILLKILIFLVRKVSRLVQTIRKGE